jgi:flavin-dependent dehydrogenase
MKSGMLAAEAAFDELSSSKNNAGAAADLSAYEGALKENWVWEELQRERNIRPSYVLPLKGVLHQLLSVHRHVLPPCTDPMLFLCAHAFER